MFEKSRMKLLNDILLKRHKNLDFQSFLYTPKQSLEEFFRLKSIWEKNTE